MTSLLHANVLIALVITDHVHHDAAHAWLASSDTNFATCPITEGSLVRLLVREGQAADQAIAIIRGISASPRHEFWPDSLAYTDVSMRAVIGHRQVTDAYLAALARTRSGRLATFDTGLAALHTDVAELIPAP